MNTADLIRAAIVILGAGTLGSTVTVLVLYFITWAQGKNSALPLHVWTIALSYLLIQGSFGAASFQRIGENTPISVYTILWGIGCVIGIFSMVTIGARQYQRLTGGSQERR